MFDAKHRKRTTPEEAAHKKKSLGDLAARKLKERRREQQARMDKARDAENARVTEQIRAEVRAEEARKARIAKAVADDEQRTGGAGKRVLL